MEAIRVKNCCISELEESEIINRILSGEKECYEILVRRNNPKLYRVIRWYTQDEAEIEDIMQDTYVKAFIKLHQFKLESSFSTWLIRIGINMALSQLREKSKLSYLNGQLNVLKTGITLEIADTKKMNPYEKMIQKDAKRILRSAIDQLDSKYKSVYVMREVQEMNMKEIAMALNLTVTNVKVRLHRAKEMLKVELHKITNGSDFFEFGFGLTASILIMQ